jgi:hypothetical protein
MNADDDGDGDGNDEHGVVMNIMMMLTIMMTTANMTKIYDGNTYYGEYDYEDDDEDITNC